MNLEQIWAEVEEDLQWRIDEIRFLSNQLINLPSEEFKDRFRRSITLMLYAHFEGYCKFLFLTYIKAVNQENLHCKDVNFALAASSMSRIFAELRNPDRKSESFRRILPEEGKLHRFARDLEFIENIQAFELTPVNISDEIANTESNLKPIVLSKILYYLGFDHEAFKALEGGIHRLLNMRNKIAHGEQREGVTESDYNEVSTSTLRVMNETKRFIMQSLTTRSFLRPSA
jgi:hypothetical protein